MLALTLCALLAVASAQVFVWNGGNTNFSNADNWAGARRPQLTAPTATPCGTFFGSPNPNRTIISQLSGETYIVGSDLFFPQNGVLRLSLNVTIAFTSSATCNPSLPAYNWTGGVVQEQRNDFYCHRNWILQNTKKTPVPTPGTLGKLVPCADNQAIFSQDSAYSVFIPNNVSFVTLSSLTVENITFTDLSSTSRVSDEVNLFNPQVPIQFGSNSDTSITSLCRSNYALEDNLGECLCYSTCLSVPDQAIVVQAIRTEQAAEALAVLSTANNQVLTDFQFLFAPSAIGLPLSDITTAVTDSQETPILVQAVITALNGTGYALISPSVSMSGGFVQFVGTLNTTSILLAAPGTNNLPPNPFLWTSTGPAGVGVTQFQILSQIALTHEISKYVASHLATQLSQDLASLDASSKNIVNFLVANPKIQTSGSVLTEANLDPCFSTCETNCSLCIPDLTSLLQSKFSLNATTAQQLAGNLAVSKSSSTDPNTWPSTNPIDSLVSTTLTSNQASLISTQSTLQSFVGTKSIVFGNGVGSSQLIQLGAVSPTNKPNLISTITKALASSGNLKSVSNVQVNYVADTSSSRRRRLQLNFVPDFVADISNAFRRRRGGTASALVVSFNYVVTCASNDVSCQSLQSALDGLTQNLKLAFNSFTVNPNLCFPNYGLNFTESCVVSHTNTYCSNNPGSTRDQQAQYVLSLIACGSYPPLPTGGCLLPDPNINNDVVNDIVAKSSSCVGLIVAASSGGGGGSVAMAAGAAIGGVVVLLAVVAFILYRRRRQAGGQGTQKDKDRTIVAFENPMYTDPTAKAQEDTYGHNPLEEQDGLYDEPAFQKAKKSNPLYSSHDDLGGGLGANVNSGYLDISPEGTFKPALDKNFDETDSAMESRSVTNSAVTADSGEPAYDTAAGEPAYDTAAGEPAYDTAAGEPAYQSGSVAYGRADPIYQGGSVTYDSATTAAGYQDVDPNEDPNQALSQSP